MMHREGSMKNGVQTQDHGFSLLEMMVALVILLSVAGIVMSAIMQMTLNQGTIGNRTEMHSSVRSATEVIQQEIGHAGRIPALPNYVTLSAAAAAGSSIAKVNSVAGMFITELLVVDAGQMGSGLQNPETVTISSINSTTTPPSFQATFAYAHAAGAPVVVAGAFPGGIIPNNATSPLTPSTPSLLKMFGDINGDGKMVYVEYNCDGGNLTRSVTPFDATSKNSPHGDFAEYLPQSSCQQSNALFPVSTEAEWHRHQQRRGRDRHFDSAYAKHRSTNQSHSG